MIKVMESKKNKKDYNIKLLSCNVVSPIGAGCKAPLDVSNIIKDKYHYKEKNINLYESNNKLINKLKGIIFSIRRIINILFTNNKTFYIIQSNYFQYPFYAKIFTNLWEKILSSKNIILLIHDINGLRYLQEDYLKKEIKIYNCAKYIVAHNYAMKKFLIESGIDKQKIYELECFDYLCSNEIIKHAKNNKLEICYAGNLSKNKSKFLYQIDSKKLNFTLNIYGQGIDKNISDNIIYNGTYNSGDVRKTLVGDLGLVWDGEYDENDEDKYYKNYTKYNNPHKLSCYLAADLPVIVWKKSAIAKFVKENNIGYLINNIYDINKINQTDYEIKKKNAKEIGKKVREGYYTSNVLEKIINDIEKSLE